MDHDDDVGAARERLAVAGLLVAAVAHVVRMQDDFEPSDRGDHDGVVVARIVDDDDLSTMSCGRSRQVASSVRPAWNAGMTTTMRLAFSIGRLAPRGQAERDQGGILVGGRAESLAQRGLAMRGVGSDRLGVPPIGLHVGLLPDDVVDALLRERRVVGEVNGIAEAEPRVSGTSPQRRSTQRPVR